MSNLSTDEASLGRIKSMSPSERRAVEQAEDSYYEATKYRQHFETLLRESLPDGFDFNVVLDFADWKAREVNARDRLLRMGGSAANG